MEEGEVKKLNLGSGAEILNCWPNFLHVICSPYTSLGVGRRDLGAAMNQELPEQSPAAPQPSPARAPRPKLSLGVQSSRAGPTTCPASKWKHNCCQGNTQIAKLKYGSALNEPKRSCRKFTQVQQRFLAECGEEIIKRDPSPVVEEGEGAQHNFAT